MAVSTAWKASVIFTAAFMTFWFDGEEERQTRIRSPLS